MLKAFHAIAFNLRIVYKIIMKALFLISFLLINYSFNIDNVDSHLFVHPLNGGSESKDEERDNPRGIYTLISYSSYFSKLHTNFGNNQTESTCGYVALAMLLTYYDNIVNDCIVSDGFEVAGSSVESPGTLREPDSNYLTFNPDSVSTYYTFLRYYKNTALHSYLILKDKDALFNNPPINYIASTYKAEFGTDEYSLASLAQSYLSDMNIYSPTITIVCKTSYGTSYSIDDIVDEIIDEIDDNRPVIVGFKNHARIVYGYSYELSGIIKFRCHEGYIGEEAVNKTAPSDLLSGQYPGGIGYVSLHFNFNS